MKKLTTLLCAIILVPIISWSAGKESTACTGNVVLSSQAEVDAFNCTSVDGDLTISGNNISNIAALSDLENVSGKLIIRNNPNLADIKPLTSLTSVGSLIVVNNTLIRTLNGLFNLSNIDGNLSIKGNAALVNFAGIGPFRKVLNLEISNNPELENIDGLDKLVEADVILINDNVKLQNVDGLSRLRMLTHMQITMNGNSSLQNCCGLYNLWTSGTVYGVIDIENNGVSCNREDVIFECDPNETTCFATSVVSYQPGTTKDGRPISFERGFPMKALGTPQENDEINFVALGFGGSLTLKLGDDIYDDGSDLPEFIIVETSFGLASARCFENGQFNNPESAFIELSADGITWFSSPNIQCRTTFIDIKPAVDDGLPFARYVRITDSSNPQYFVGESDGYDVDGLIICSEEVLAGFDRLTNNRTAQSARGLFDPNFFNVAPDDINPLEMAQNGLLLYPNPVTNDVTQAVFKATSVDDARVEVIDLSGKTVQNEEFKTVIGENKLDVNISNIPDGQYILMIHLKDQKLVQKFVK